MADFQSIGGLFAGLRPEPRLSVSQWADTYRHLSAVSSAEPGLWRTSRTPYLREIMDNLSAWSPVVMVVVMKGAQVGMTEAGNNWLGYIIDVSPGPTLAVMPTVDLAEKNSKIRIDPMIAATERLKNKIRPARARDSGNTTFLKEFPGGVLSMTGANSAAGLRSMPARFLFLDEVDSYPQDLQGEGSPIELAKARTRTFARKKIFALSTPTIEGQSIIQAEFDQTDQRYYHVPCPECGFAQKLEFGQLRWEPGKYDQTCYQCAGCGHLIAERFKTVMFAAGHWVAECPENASPTKVGYHINSLYSPFGWYSWGDAAEEFDRATKDNDDNRMKTFVNTVLGQCWVAKGEVPPWKELFNRREAYPANVPPVGVCLITAGIDVQADRLEVEIVGWGKGKESWSIDYRVFYGDPAEAEVWAKVDALINTTWTRSDGIVLPLYRVAIDSGYATSHVYQFCRKYPANRVVPVKGQDALAVAVSAPRAVDKTQKGKEVAGGTRVWSIGTSFLKTELYGWLRLSLLEDGSAPAGYCHFPEYDETYFKGLTAEKLQFKIKNGYKKFEWVKHYSRNEPLDCRVYARAAAAQAGIDRWTAADYDALVKQYDAPKKMQPAQKKRQPSGFWS